jgi:hypothetical protein
MRARDAGAGFRWHHPDSPAKDNFTAWSIFPASTGRFGDNRPDFMMNYFVDDHDAVLDALRKEGFSVDRKVEECDCGKFSWIVDPWEPHQTLGALPTREKQ